MADMMTLEQVRDAIRDAPFTSPHTHENAVWAGAIDAAIRERDRLRGDVSGMTEELLRVPSREEWRALQKRAERAEAELAAALKANRDCVDHFEQMQAELVALRARIEAAPLTTFRRAMLGTPHAWVEEKFACPEWIGKRVRLVVEE